MNAAPHREAGAAAAGEGNVGSVASMLVASNVHSNGEAIHANRSE